MQLVVFTVLAGCGMVISYAFGQGGPVAGLVFFGILFIGVFLRVTQPLIDRLTKP
jgi:hypothetical protein